MADIAIRVEGLGKQYRLGENLRYRTMRESWRQLLGRKDGRSNEDVIWALRNVSCEVKQGEVIGVIGRNGAGKSTLLKILSRITRPTEGLADIHGRVGSLLEVGTGFHPELTGRENIFLNGAILGMTRREVQIKFDEIVAFAEIEKFLDTPVKRYSSGMYVRLAFAVAAHLEPEILLVDEVLAVGDAHFQRKCLGKMGDVAGHGRTVLFVSHNLSAVGGLCGRCLLIDGGRVKAYGETDKVIEQYTSGQKKSSMTPVVDRTDRRGNGKIRFTHVTVRGETIDSTDSDPVCGKQATIIAGYTSSSTEDLQNPRVAVLFMDDFGSPLFICDTQLNHVLSSLPPSGEISCIIPRLPLAAGSYQIRLWASINGHEADLVDNAARISVVDGDFFGSGQSPIKTKHGPFLVDQDWSILSPQSGMSHTPS
jgi:lipopolysaccharide transport system ATP-binding protein